MKKKLIFITIWLLFVAGCYYFMLPPLNIHSKEFWTFLLSVRIVPAIILNAIYRASGIEKFDFKRFFARVSRNAVNELYIVSVL